MAIRLEPITQEFKVENKLALAGIGAVVAALTAVAGAAALAVKSTFDWAGELDSIQDVMGVTNKEAAALNFVLRKSGTETEKLTKGMVVLEKGLFKADGSLDTVGKRMAEFGISALDVNGQMKDQNSLISEISNKYNSLSSQTERVNFLTEIFGKSGADLIDVFDTLAAEGGLDKTAEKVEKLGLVIDPAKYEKFTRNLEEIKLAGLGVAVTFVDTLMPAVESFSKWWETDGIAAFQGAVKWLQTNMPIAIDKTKKSFESANITWKNNVTPTLRELIRLWENLSAIATRLDPQVGSIAGKFTLLGATQRIAVGWATFVNDQLANVRFWVDLLNDALERLIGNWGRLSGAAQSAATGVANAVARIPSVPSAPSTGSSGGRTTTNTRGRANQGDLGRGMISAVNERKQEVFLPGMSGSVRSGLDLNIKFSDNELDRLGRSMARSLKPVLQRSA